jgi:hypothetical protein
MGRRLNIPGLLIAVVIVPSCVSRSRPADAPDAIFVPSSARELRVAPGVGTGQVDVSYSVTERYPAAGIRRSLTHALRDGGYELLDHDFLYTGQRLEVPREWWSYVSREGDPERCQLGHDRRLEELARRCGAPGPPL